MCPEWDSNRGLGCVLLEFEKTLYPTQPPRLDHSWFFEGADAKSTRCQILGPIYLGLPRWFRYKGVNMFKKCCKIIKRSNFGTIFTSQVGQLHFVTDKCRSKEIRPGCFSIRLWRWLSIKFSSSQGSESLGFWTTFIRQNKIEFEFSNWPFSLKSR